MNDLWYNNIVNKDFDVDYENVMNHIEKQINYHATKDASMSIGGGNDGVPIMETTITTMMIVTMTMMTISMMTTSMMMKFYRRQFEKEKLIIFTAGATYLYYINYMHKEPYMVSYNTSMRWLTKLLNGHWKGCVNMFRMDTSTLTSL